MRPPIRAAVLSLFLAALTIAQEAPDAFLAERILAPNALVFLSVPQTAAVSEDYAKSNLAALVNHPEIKSFTGPLESWWKKRKTQPANVGGFDFFNLAIVLIAYFFWCYKEVVAESATACLGRWRARWLMTPRSDPIAAVLLDLSSGTSA